MKLGNTRRNNHVKLFDLHTALLSVIQHLQKSQYFFGNDFQYSVL